MNTQKHTDIKHESEKNLSKSIEYFEDSLCIVSPEEITRVVTIELDILPNRHQVRITSNSIYVTEEASCPAVSKTSLEMMRESPEDTATDTLCQLTCRKSIQVISEVSIHVYR